MTKLNWTEWLGVAVVALAVALVVVLAGAVGLQTFREHQALLNVVGYNIQQGRLLALPAAPPVAPAVQAPATPAPAEPPKKPAT